MNVERRNTMPAAVAAHPCAFPKTHATFSARLYAQDIIQCSRIGSKEKKRFGRRDKEDIGIANQTEIATTDGFRYIGASSAMCAASDLTNDLSPVMSLISE